VIHAFAHLYMKAAPLSPLNCGVAFLFPFLSGIVFPLPLNAYLFGKI